MSRRTERIGSLIRRLIARAVQSELHDPRIEPLTSVTRVAVSADLSVAQVYVSVFSQNESRRRLTIEALQHAAGMLRTRLARELTMRQVPALLFHLDDSLRDSFETVRVIEGLVAQAARHEPEPNAPDSIESCADPGASAGATDDATRPDTADDAEEQ